MLEYVTPTNINDIVGDMMTRTTTVMNRKNTIPSNKVRQNEG